MIGGTGDDDMTGGNLGDVMQDPSGGNDTMRGGDGGDTLVDTLGFNALFGGNGNDLLSDGSIDATLLDGGNDNDTLFSSGGNDTLFGSDGNDVLEDQSGLDFDVFTGGNGADIFVYRLTNDGGAATTVTDFQDGIDLIGIRFANEAFGFLEVATVGADAVVTFTGGLPNSLP